MKNALHIQCRSTETQKPENVTAIFIIQIDTGANNIQMVLF